MQTYLIIDPETGRGIGSSQSGAPNYEPHDHEVPCSPEQYANPAGWMLNDGDLVEAPASSEPNPSLPVITYKADIWRRATDEEAEQMDEALASLPVRQRRMYADAQYLNHGDEMFAVLSDALVHLFGEPRAIELLTPSA
ncbi:hypothetical protein [Methylobacterium dankookense]|uniref:Uncharacterized protein n=1 Tax=Methylobacterium dankookense TaxID=560405 RepID=A0A564G6G8_9HYPH|nr:hypothetical protein [Methylobacterium dankookense]GJD58343.1 hypothetical protein IFDJLNFL_4262 [Methylobacterium dankookense]VUF15652.1 hypothetical protein MTDSW087_05396 [Methylobacterium dankookense]